MVTRRAFLTRTGGLAAIAVLAPQEAAFGLTSRRARPFRAGRFSDGVLSGDPTPNGITLWTRLDGASGPGRVRLEVATDRDFRRVVATKSVTTSSDVGHAVKSRVTGLKPYEQYYYRFATATEDSPVGRFRTALPADSQQPVRFAFFSCQDYTHGWYNAHEIMARDDLDFVVCLGDYIYAETYHSKATKTAVREDRIGRTNPTNPGIVREAVTLADYRAKYSLYRSDASLRKMHQRFPMVVVWDDHETQDNDAGAERDGGLAAGKRFSLARRAAARRAFFENMPYFAPRGTQRLYRSLRFGRTVELVMMDQRQYRADQPCGDAIVPACADLDQPRPLLGATQMNWVKQRLASSPAAWKILGNEVMIMPTKVLGDAFYTFDSWQGYPREREELLSFIRDRQIKDVVFVTGDIHTFIAGDVRTNLGAGDSVALEFVGGSITSQGLGEIDLPAGNGVVIKGNDQNPRTDPAILEALRGVNPWIDQADTDHHGYGKVTATPSSLTCELVRVPSIKRKSTQRLPSAQFTYTVQRGQTSIKGVHGPAA